MRTVFTLAVMAIVTPVLALMVLVASLIRIPDRPGSIYDWAPQLWSRIALRVAGVRLVVDGGERLGEPGPCVLAVNHTSWYDIFTIGALLRRKGYVAKAELFRIPLFGPAARRCGVVPIQRENRKAAFAAYEEAAQWIRGGRPVVVFPEGTRGRTGALGPFKKGPFVLAIAAQVPVVPVAIHGTRHVQPSGSFRIRAGTVHVHVLDAIPTAGLTYDARDDVARSCWNAIAGTLRTVHGIDSATPKADRVRADATRAVSPEPAPGASIGT